MKKLNINKIDRLSRLANIIILLFLYQVFKLTEYAFIIRAFLIVFTLHHLFILIKDLTLKNK